MRARDGVIGASIISLASQSERQDIFDITMIQIYSNHQSGEATGADVRSVGLLVEIYLHWQGALPKFRWDIKKDRHADLIMINATITRLHLKVAFTNYSKSTRIGGAKAVVTKSLSISAYAQLITDHGKSVKSMLV